MDGVGDLAYLLRIHPARAWQGLVGIAKAPIWLHGSNLWKHLESLFEPAGIVIKEEGLLQDRLESPYERPSQAWSARPWTRPTRSRIPSEYGIYRPAFRPDSSSQYWATASLPQAIRIVPFQIHLSVLAWGLL